MTATTAITTTNNGLNTQELRLGLYYQFPAPWVRADGSSSLACLTSQSNLQSPEPFAQALPHPAATVRQRDVRWTCFGKSRTQPK